MNQIEHKLQDRLMALIGEFCLLDPSSLSRGTLTDDIGLDSLSLTQIVTAMEAEFSLDLSEEDLTRLLDARAIGDFADVLTFARDRPGYDSRAEAARRE